MPQIQAITFDAAGTLIHLAESVGDSYSRIAAQYGIHATPDALNTAFRSVWKKTPPPFSDYPTQQDSVVDSTGAGRKDVPTPLDGKLARQRSEDGRETAPQDSPYEKGPVDDSTGSSREIDPEKEWWRDLVRAVFSEAEAPQMTRFDDFFEALFDHFESPGCWLLDEAANDVLKHFRARNFRLGLLSNFDSRLRRILSDLDVFHHFDAVVLSGEIQASKPDQRMFETIQQQLNITDPATVLHVGDDQEADIMGAERAGFHTHFVKLRKAPLRTVLDFDFP